MIVPQFYHNKENKETLPKPKRRLAFSFEKVFKVKQKEISTRKMTGYKQKKHKQLQFQKPQLRFDRWALINKLDQPIANLSPPKPKVKYSHHKRSKTSYSCQSQRLLSKYKERKNRSEYQMLTRPSSSYQILQAPSIKLFTSRAKTASPPKRQKRNSFDHKTTMEMFLAGKNFTEFFQKESEVSVLVWTKPQKLNPQQYQPLLSYRSHQQPSSSPSPHILKQQSQSQPQQHIIAQLDTERYQREVQSHMDNYLYKKQNTETVIKPGVHKRLRKYSHQSNLKACLAKNLESHSKNG